MKVMSIFIRLTLVVILFCATWHPTKCLYIIITPTTNLVKPSFVTSNLYLSFPTLTVATGRLFTHTHTHAHSAALCKATRTDSSAQCCGHGGEGAHGAEQRDEMLPSRRTQMDSLVQPLVAQYLAMGCQSKENIHNESASSDDKRKDDA